MQMRERFAPCVYQELTNNRVQPAQQTGDTALLARWSVYDSTMMLLVGTTIWKIRIEDVHQIERQIGREVETLSETELRTALCELEIKDMQTNTANQKEQDYKTTVTIINLLQELKELYDAGIVSDDEFESGKSKLLESL